MKPTSFTLHALDRFIERAKLSGVRPGRAMNKFFNLISRAEYLGIRKDGKEEWLSVGWVLLVRDGMVVTIFKPKGKRQTVHYYGLRKAFKAATPKTPAPAR